MVYKERNIDELRLKMEAQKLMNYSENIRRCLQTRQKHFNTDQEVLQSRRKQLVISIFIDVAVEHVFDNTVVNENID